MTNLSDILTNYQSVDTLDSVTGRGATTTNDLTIGSLLFSTGASLTSSGVNSSLQSVTGNTGSLGLYGGSDYNSGSGIAVYGASHSTQANKIRFFTSGFTERMVMDSSGNMGIDETSPAARLHVRKSSATDNAYNTLAIFQPDVSDTAAEASLYINSYPSTTVVGDRKVEIDSLTQNGTAVPLVLNRTGGNVGINQSQPSAKLHVTGANLGSTQYDKSQLGWFHHYNGNVSYLEIFGFRTSAGSSWTTAATRIEQRIDSTSQSYIQFNGTDNNYGISFGAGSGINNADSEDIVERCRITALGEVLFNRTSTPNISNSFDFGWRKDLGSLYLNCASATGPLLLNQTTGDTATRNEIRFFRNEVQVGSVTANTTTTFYNTTSDYRVKENVVPLENALDRIKQIPVRRFNFIADPDTTVDGFIAHEVAEFVPEAIYGEKDGMQTEEYEITPAVLDDMGNTLEDAVMGTREVPDYQGIDQSKLVPLLTKAIQELEARVAALEAN